MEKGRLSMSTPAEPRIIPPDEAEALITAALGFLTETTRDRVVRNLILDLAHTAAVLGEEVAELRTAEQFCGVCFAGVESDEHHEKCVAPLDDLREELAEANRRLAAVDTAASKQVKRVAKAMYYQLMQETRDEWPFFQYLPAASQENWMNAARAALGGERE
jgi:hypothetical protein